MPTILFVCTGNTCRSPMAEYLLKNMLNKEEIKDWQVKSAGIHALPGTDINDKTQKVLAEEGITVENHASNTLSSQLIDEADIIFTMTAAHKSYLLNEIKEKDKIFTLKEFLNKNEKDISDPYGQSLKIYRQLKEELQNLLPQLFKKLDQYFAKKGFSRKIKNNINRSEKMKIAIGSDHAGFKLKGKIIKYFDKEDFQFKDMGTSSEESVDYPDIARQVAQGVASNNFDRGILICGTGIGMSISANKVKGVRAALCHDVFSAKVTRHHNNSNVLTMGSRVIGRDLALEITRAWLESDFKGDSQPRHQRRIDKVGEIESNC